MEILELSGQIRSKATNLAIYWDKVALAWFIAPIRA